MNIASYVAKAIGTAKRLGLTAEVTISRSTSASYAASSDTPAGVSAASFTVTATSDSPRPDAPNDGALAPQRSVVWTMNAVDCAFVPESGHTLTTPDGQVWRIIDVGTTEVGTTAVLYDVEVAR